MVMAQKMNHKAAMLWFGIKFPDYGTTIVAQLSLHTLRGRFIGNLLLLLSRSS